jgi:SAM-dependent methyltransferase
VSKVDFDEFTGSYNELLREQTGFFSEDEEYFARYKVALTRELVRTEPRKILEYGCGIGRNIKFLRQTFPSADVFGSDISAASLELAKSENPGVQFWQEDATQPPTSEFDLIFVAGVFHHVPPQQRGGVAQVLFERTSVGGQLIVFEHNPYNPVTRRIVRDCPYDADAVLLRPSEVKGRLTQAGFRSLNTGFSLFFPPTLRRLVRTERFLRWLPLGGQYWVSAHKA